MLVWDAMERGLTGWILRPGMICGHRKSGATNRVDTDSRLLAGLLQLGVVPEVEASQVPSD